MRRMILNGSLVCGGAGDDRFVQLVLGAGHQGGRGSTVGDGEPRRQADRSCHVRTRQLSQVLRRLPRRAGRRRGRERAMARTQAAQFSLWQYSSAAPPQPGRCRWTEILFDTIGRGLDSSNMPSWNAAYRARAGGPGGLRKALLAALCHRESRALQSKSRRSRAAYRRTPQGRPGSFQRVECWKCHGAHGNGATDLPPPPSLTTRTGRLPPTTFMTGSASSAAPPTRTCTGSS